jgi:outer membrane protein assembly factor BamB
VIKISAILQLAVAAIAGLCLPLCAAQDWPMFMGTQAHTGYAGEAPLPDVRKLKREWKIDLHTEIVASPAIVGQTMYLGAENGNLYAFDLPSKTLQWLFHSRGGISSTPAVGGGLVYFMSRDGHFYALDEHTGAPRWTFQTLGESTFAAHGMYGITAATGPTPDPWDFFLSSPVLHHGKVYFGSSDERLYALDAATGKLAWVFKTGGVIHSSPAVAQNTVLVGSWDGILYALDADSGAERWRFKTETEQKNSVMLGIQSSPGVDKDTVYIGARDGYMYALDLATGSLKWRYNAAGSWIVGTPAIDSSKVYVGTSDTGLLVALDKQTGREVYRFDTKVWTYSSPLLVGDTLWVGTMKGELFALQASTGQLRWSYQSEEGKADSFRILNAQGRFDTARLYGTQPHQLYSALEHVKRLGAFVSSPVWHQGQLIIANSMGEIAGFGSRAVAAKK